MSKYSAPELKAMAQIVLEDHAKGGEKAFLLILNMSIQTNMTPADVLARIRSYVT